MGKARCFISETHDPWFNLATEDWIFNDMDTSEHILFLWRNNRTVVIGRNQNPWAECNVKKMEESSVNLVRRQSGGGAVFQDLGNTNFTFLSSRSAYDRKRNFQIIINALKKHGVEAETSGRNDILVGGKKISGSAFKENPDRAFHHGTLLINVNLGELADYLTPSKKKLMSKGTTSVRSRVANLVEFNEELKHESLAETIIEEFFKTYESEKKVEVLNHESLKKIPELNEYYDMLRSKDWVFGETPNFNHHLNERFDWGTIDLHLNSEKGKISDVKVFSDCLQTDFVNLVENSLKGLDYNSDSISNKFESVIKENPHFENNIQDMILWIKKEI